MSLLSQLFGKYSLLAKEIYEQYLKGKEPVTKEDVDYAVSQYEKDNSVQITPYVEVLKKKMLLKDFIPSERYFQTKKILEERWCQQEQTKRSNTANREAFLKKTDALIGEITDEIIEDKVFMARNRCFNLALAYKKAYRRYMRLINNPVSITDFLAVSPVDYHLFKIQKIKALINAKENVPENQHKRIITQTMRFIKSIERR